MVFAFFEEQRRKNKDLIHKMIESIPGARVVDELKKSETKTI